jgi:hypothetical protein
MDNIQTFINNNSLDEDNKDIFIKYKYNKKVQSYLYNLIYNYKYNYDMAIDILLTMTHNKYIRSVLCNIYNQFLLMDNCEGKYPAYCTCGRILIELRDYINECKSIYQYTKDEKLNVLINRIIKGYYNKMEYVEGLLKKIYDNNDMLDIRSFDKIVNKLLQIYNTTSQYYVKAYCYVKLDSILNDQHMKIIKSNTQYLNQINECILDFNSISHN